jgi:two-component system, chemotaxis family, chemotaxis protein CheY
LALKDTLKMMVVDDMSVSRGLITQALEEIGIFKVLTENSAQAALDRIATSPVHLVLCDFNMPGMDGLGLLAALRANRLTQGIGFILITGSPTPEMVDRGRQLGLNNLVKKPFTPATLKQAIEAVVGRL